MEPVGLTLTLRPNVLSTTIGQAAAQRVAGRHGKKGAQASAL